MKRTTILTTFAVILLGAISCFAQDRGGQGGPGGGPGAQGQQGGPPPDFNPQAMRQRMMDRMKERLGASDEEWKVLSPKIEKVMSVQRDLRGGGGGPGGPGMGGPGGPPRGEGGGDRGPRPARGEEGPGGPPPQDQQPQSEVAKARQDLRDAVDDSNTRADELARLVKVYRDARDKAKADLSQAQKELKELVTPRQEGFFVSMGLLD